MVDSKLIRNFSIIAHIDHGKSTLADRILELTHTLSEREMTEQVLDQMELEREKGITIKSQAVRIIYSARDGGEYIFNLIDTPGHVDFSYEVSRSLAACEGVLLVVDAVQGVEAQTVANTFLALEGDLKVTPVINKIDLPNADPERVKNEIQESLGIPVQEALLVSAKTGEGVSDILEAIVSQIPPPDGDTSNPLKALIFDSLYDSYRGVIVFIRVVEGKIKPGMKVKMMATAHQSEVEEVGVFRPEMQPVSELSAGEVGYVITGVKDVRQTKVGDTITSAVNSAPSPLAGYLEPKPMVFCGLYPLEGGEYENLRQALSRLQLNDAALTYMPETSHALGFGFRGGFLGLLHMEIVKERLKREYEIELIATSPNAAYQVTLKDGTTKTVSNPFDFPKQEVLEKVEEPYISATILSPSEFIGSIMELCQNIRGKFKDMQYLSPQRVQIHYHLPLSEILLNFFDQLKSCSKGYASLDYEHIGYKETALVKLDILIAGESVDAFSLIAPKEKAYLRGRELVGALKKTIPRQLFDVSVQAAIGRRVIARETIKAMRKDVTAKLYGGDVTRKRKLLEKQKVGKKQMKKVGKVSIPQEAFLEVLKAEKD